MRGNTRAFVSPCTLRNCRRVVISFSAIEKCKCSALPFRLKRAASQLPDASDPPTPAPAQAQGECNEQVLQYQLSYPQSMRQSGNASTIQRSGTVGRLNAARCNVAQIRYSTPFHFQGFRCIRDYHLICPLEGGGSVITRSHPAHHWQELFFLLGSGYHHVRAYVLP